MKLVLDTNVFLDVLLERQPLYIASAGVLNLSYQKDFELIMPAHSAATILYIAEKNTDRNNSVRALNLCLKLVRIGTLDQITILKGLSFNFNDPEDSFVAAIAMQEGADYIVSNNVKGYQNSPVPALTPVELLARTSVQ